MSISICTRGVECPRVRCAASVIITCSLPISSTYSDVLSTPSRTRDSCPGIKVLSPKRSWPLLLIFFHFLGISALHFEQKIKKVTP